MTEFLGKLFDKVYAERDFSINVAIFVAGLAGMSCYLMLHDSVLTLFAFIISFPIVKILPEDGISVLWSGKARPLQSSSWPPFMIL